MYCKNNVLFFLTLLNKELKIILPLYTWNVFPSSSLQVAFQIQNTFNFCLRFSLKPFQNPLSRSSPCLYQLHLFCIFLITFSHWHPFKFICVCCPQKEIKSQWTFPSVSYVNFRVLERQH